MILYYYYISAAISHFILTIYSNSNYDIYKKKFNDYSTI